MRNLQRLPESQVEAADEVQLLPGMSLGQADQHYGTYSNKQEGNGKTKMQRSNEWTVSAKRGKLKTGMRNERGVPEGGGEAAGREGGERAGVVLLLKSRGERSAAQRSLKQSRAEQSNKMTGNGC